MENCSVWISFTLIKALVDEVVWDYLNQVTQGEGKRAQRPRKREEGDKETGRERESHVLLILGLLSGSELKHTSTKHLSNGVIHTV